MYHYILLARISWVGLCKKNLIKIVKTKGYVEYGWVERQVGRISFAPSDRHARAAQFDREKGNLI